MKIIRPLLIAAVIFMILISTSDASALRGAESERVRDFKVLHEDLGEALDSRNFQNVRLVVADLLDIMKEDLKASKRKIADMEKSGATEFSIKRVKTDYDRKKELYTSIHGVLKANQAALRGRAKIVMEQVEEEQEQEQMN